MTDKPWSNACTPSCDRPRLDRFCYDRDLGCPVQYLFEEFVASSTNFAAREAWDASCTEPLSACKAALLPQMACHEGELDLFTKLFMSDFVPKPSVPMANILQTCAEHEDVMSFASQSLPFTHRTQVVTCPELWLDPLSLEAVSIPEFQCPSVRLSRPQVGVAKLHGAPHTHPPEADSSSSASAVPTLRPTGTRQAGAANAALPPHVPSFALGIIRGLPIDFQTNPVRIVQGVLVRSWLLHHINLPRSLYPRQVVLRGPPHAWRAQLLQVWFADGPPGEEVAIDLVTPTPPRNWHETSVLFDVILAQGLESGRRSGLVTLSPTFSHPALHMYSVAVSLDRAISGQDLITDADLQDVCNMYACLIFQDQVHLPIDFTRNFIVEAGAGFVVYASTRDDTSSSAEAQTTEVLDPAPEPGMFDHDLSAASQDVPMAATQASAASPHGQGLVHEPIDVASHCIVSIGVQFLLGFAWHIFQHFYRTFLNSRPFNLPNLLPFTAFMPSQLESPTKKPALSFSIRVMFLRVLLIS